MPTLERLRVLLIDTDELLISDAKGLEHPEIEFSSIAPSAMSRARASITDRDAVVCTLDTPRGLELLAKLCNDKNAPPVIAVGGRGHQGRWNIC